MWNCRKGIGAVLDVDCYSGGSVDGVVFDVVCSSDRNVGIR